MTPPFDRAQIYEVARRIKAAQTLSDASEVLAKTEDLFVDIHGHEQPLWAAAKGSGLVDFIMTRLSNPQEDFRSLGIFIYRGLNTLTSCISAASRSFLPDDEQRALFTRITPMFHTSFATANELKKPSDPVAPKILKMVQVATVMFAGQVFRNFKFNERLIEPVDKEGLLCAVFDVLFDPHTPPSDPGRQLDVRCCSLALDARTFKAYSYQDRKISAVRDAVKKYGAEMIAQECALLASNPDPNISKMGVSNILSFFHYRDYPGIIQAFTKNGVHSAIAQAYWRESKGSPSPDDDLAKLLMLSRLLSDFYRHGGSRPDSPIVTVMSELLENDDLLLFIAKVLIAFTSTNQEYINHFAGRIDDLGGWMSVAFKHNPALMERHCKAEWSRLMQNLRNLERCRHPKPRGTFGGTQFAVEQWQQLGKLTKLDKTTSMTKSGKSCSWIRCPLSLQDEAAAVQWEMLECSRCHQAQYCTVSCQRRDWRSGHQAICRGSNQ